MVAASSLAGEGVALLIRDGKTWCKLVALAALASLSAVVIAGQMEGEHGDSGKAALKELQLRQSVHARLDCSECHGESEMGYSRLDPVETCASCHKDAYNSYRESIHAASVVNELPQAASCVACHGSHEVASVADPQSPVSRTRVSSETCARCHQAPSWAESHTNPPNVVTDFRTSYHGLAAAMGDGRTANCASCHSYHGVLLSSDPRSTANQRNLAITCAACHTSASSANYAAGGVHHDPQRTGFRIVDAVSTMYVMMILLTLGLMAIHNAIDLYGRIRRRILRRKSVSERTEATEHATKYFRFSINERFQHWVLAASFVTLVVTGFALTFSWQLPWLEPQKWAVTRAWLHRAAAAVFIALSVWHLGYMLFSSRGRSNLRSLLPRLRSVKDIICRCAACFRFGPPSAADWRDLISMVKYDLGFASEPPAMGRFNYAEKLEYFGLVWGSTVMIASGLALWFATSLLNYIPYWTIDLATTVHYYEAILAALSIFVWHFYFTIFNPDVFPLSTTMFTGDLGHEEMERDHLGELKGMRREKE